MKKGWNITEKVIATILQAWALYFLYSLTTGIYDRLHFGLQSGRITQQDVKFGELFKDFHLSYIAGILCLYSGLALLYDKKKGWIASVIATLLFMGFMLASGRTGVLNDENNHKMMSVGHLIAAAVFAALFVLLVLKPFRVKYRVSFGNWIFIAVIVVLAVLDKTIFPF